MKTLTKPYLLLMICMLFACNGFSQISLSHYSSSLPKVGVAYHFNEKLWTELRVYTNTFIEDFTPEAVVCLNVKRNEKYNIYAGIGGVANFYTGFVLPVGLQVSPFEKFANFSFHIECQPTITTEGDGIFQGAWGFRYKFNKKE